MYKIEQIHVSCWKIIGPGLKEEFVFYEKEAAETAMKICETISKFYLGLIC